MSHFMLTCSTEKKSQIDWNWQWPVASDQCAAARQWTVDSDQWGGKTGIQDSGLGSGAKVSRVQRCKG